MTAVQVDEDRLLRTFLDLVAIDSPTGSEEVIGRALEERFSRLACTPRRDDVGNLVAVLSGTRPGTILVSTHMDTAGTDRGIVPVIGDDGGHPDRRVHHPRRRRQVRDRRL